MSMKYLRRGLDLDALPVLHHLKPHLYRQDSFSNARAHQDSMFTPSVTSTCSLSQRPNLVSVQCAWSRSRVEAQASIFLRGTTPDLI